MSWRRFDFGLLAAWLCLELPAQAGPGLTAQYGQTISGSSGDVFMQEVLPPPYPRWPSPPFWATPRGGYLWPPGVTEFESTSTIRPLFTSRSVP